MIRTRFIPVALVALVTSATSAFPASFDGGTPGYTPQVPVSAFARPASWLDPSRLHVTASFSMGSGFGSGVQALQTTTFRYDFGAPFSMSLSLGNNLGSGFSSSRGSFFLQGLDAAYRPFGNLQVQVHYRNVRSPLQVSSGFEPGIWGP
jgi:hypothetical protein